MLGIGSNVLTLGQYKTVPQMENLIKNIEINNFKSIKGLRLDCKQVNLFIGKPNVGKSNILEALGLLSNPSYYTYHFGEGVLRFESLHNFFYDEDTNNTIEITTNNQRVEITLTPDDIFEFLILNKQINKDEKNINLTDYYERDKPYVKFGIKAEGSIQERKDEIKKGIDSFCKKYTFKLSSSYSSKFPDFLIPPHGENLFVIVDRNQELKGRVAALSKEQGLDFVLDRRNAKFEFQKRVDEYIYQYPYSSIADTFQRFIFYLAAIESNNHSVLIFEEPEVHSFPPYVRELAERMVLKDDNQYFISTHSPYLLQTFIDSLDATQLNVYLTYYRNYQTQVKALTPDELRDIQDAGYDVFFNLSKFEPNE